MLLVKDKGWGRIFEFEIFEKWVKIGKIKILNLHWRYQAQEAIAQK